MAPANREALIASGLGMVSAIAAEIARKVPPWIEIDDLIQVGRVALCRAADRYRQERGVGFATYAKFRVRGAILDHLSDACRHNAEVSLDAEAEIEDHAAADILDHGTAAAELRRAIAQLPEVQRRVMALALEGYTCTEIAERTGSTFGSVWTANVKALKRLRVILEKAA